jgi:pSer/pThr/pTyr-binding forkhead associated (FHA) protein
MGKWHVVLNDRVLDTFWVQEGQTVTIGRGEAADVSVDNVAVSRQHATIELRNGLHFLTDLRSVNGTFINGLRLEGTIPVTETDRIEIGKFRFVLVPASERVASDNAFDDFESTLFVTPKDRRGPRLTVIQGTATGSQFYLGQKKTVTLGADATCDVWVPGWLIAKTQCYIRARGGEHYLAHNAGLRRTTLNGKKIRGEHILRKGDTIGIGGTKLRFE